MLLRINTSTSAAKIPERYGPLSTSYAPFDC
ncbi:hypothetical protein D2V07_09420 [Aurantiacibacter zhengii]|uniref:Uncharacterized protein n=1 Tax=Aurantiacibacter zhengii TaxID=2307003 RepID=A0A418NTB4_9SPHN|nr:hypothetical protein D2V07_09420 [Aurantiacibacter zhengii]